MNIVLVDDEKQMLAGLAKLLSLEGHRVESFDTFASARAAIQVSPCDLLISDFFLDTGTGLDLAREVWKMLPSLKVVLMSASDPSEIDLAMDEESKKKVLFIEKPFRLNKLLELVKSQDLSL
ncbi:MAG: response regulator [Spirochaetia bacterium]|nr:response regulator [Spirochaetia bacterium]